MSTADLNWFQHQVASWPTASWPTVTNVLRRRGPRASFIPDAERWADLWEADRPAIYLSTSSDGRARGIPPWENYDPCALPVFAVWPIIDRMVSAWRTATSIPTEAKHRCSAAAYVIRHGEREW
jgi:hypothetical protein